MGRPVAAIGADIDEGLASSQAALEDAFKEYFVGMEVNFRIKRCSDMSIS